MNRFGRRMLLVALMIFPVAAEAQVQIRRPAEWSRSDSALTSKYQEQLRLTLQTLKAAQHTYRRSHHTYAPSIQYLDDPAGSRPVYILEATESGWSAVVFHERAPGIRCYIREGNARPLTDRVEHDGSPGCYGAAVALLSNPPDSLVTVTFASLMPQPPQQHSCAAASDQVRNGRLARSRQSGQGFEGRAKLRFIVGTDGEVEPGGITIVESSSNLAALDALVLVVNCGYDAGIVNGYPVRVMVQQQINFAPN